MAAKVRRGAPAECWEWTARATCYGGYGAINAGRVSGRMRAHRVAWALAGNDLPADKVLCHRCDNPKCCNPGHLFLGSQGDNHADMRRKGRMSKPPVHRGESHHRVTIPDSEIPFIRSHVGTYAELARKYGVAGITIRRIKTGVSR